MKKILLAGLIIIVLILGLSIGLFVSNVDRSSDYDNRDKISGNVISEVRETCERCDTITIPTKGKKNKYEEELSCLGEIKETDSQYEKCNFNGYGLIDKYSNLVKEGYVQLVTCRCCYDYEC